MSWVLIYFFISFFDICISICIESESSSPGSKKSGRDPNCVDFDLSVILLVEIPIGNRYFLSTYDGRVMVVNFVGDKTNQCHGSDSSFVHERNLFRKLLQRYFAWKQRRKLLK